VLLAIPWGYLYPDFWLKRKREQRRRFINKELPFYLDVITLSVEAGTNLTGGNKALSSVVSGMVQAERSGASLGPVLRAQATQLRDTRFAEAEKRAMEAPVRLLAPLLMFIFPTTFIVLGFLVLSKMLLQDMIPWQPIIWAYTWPYVHLHETRSANCACF